jgi:transposase
LREDALIAAIRGLRFPTICGTADERCVERAGSWTEQPISSARDDYVIEEKLVRAVDVFIDCLDLDELGFVVQPLDTGRPGYHPGMMLKLYVYGAFSIAFDRAGA